MKNCTIFLFLFLFSCTKQGIKEEKTNNPNFEVTLLFEYDGIKVYRFRDDGRYHWFTSKGECINAKLKYIPMGKTSMIIKEDETIN